MRTIACLATVLVAACSSNRACLDYTDTYAACIAEAESAGLPVDVDVSDPEGFCEEIDSPDEEWACLSAAYASGDCTTEAGLAAILVEADGCIQ
jgi:hypothetical protein